MSWAAIAATVVGTAASVGVAAASQPELVNPAKSSRKTVLASLKAYPAQRQVEMASKLGTKVDYAANNWMRPREAYKKGLITEKEWRYYQRLNEKKGLGIFGDLMPGTEPLTTGPNQGQNQDQRKGKHGGREVRVKNGHMQINIGQRTADFTGMGDADVQGKLARASAETMLALQKKYGPEFIAEALKQQEQADPEGTAARKLLASEIARMEEERKTRERPVAEALKSDMGEQGLTGKVGGAGVAGIEQVLSSRGDSTAGVEGVLQELQTGPAGEARKNDQLRKMTAYLSSGASPEDAAFREKQNSLANMSSFLAGRTPQSQFSSLSGAQQGAAPNVAGGQLPGMNPNAQALGNVAGANSYAAGVRATANNVSPWFAGLSLLTKGLSTAGQAGWQPAAG